MIAPSTALRTSSSTALRTTGRANPVTYGSQAQVACARGDVWAAAACVGFDRRRRIASYALRIANNTALALRARLHSGTVTASDLAVAPFSIVETLVPMKMSAAPNDRAVVEVDGPGVAFSIDAPLAIAQNPAVRDGTPAIAAMLGVLLLLLGIAAAALAGLRTPRTVAHAPARATHPVLAAHRHVRRTSSHDTQPLLDDLSVAPLPARAGGTLRVTYATAAAAGDVWLLDLHGQVWAHTAIDRSGTTWLHVPPEAAGREMRVVVHAQRGTAHAQAAAGIIVVPDDSNVAVQVADATAPAPSVRVDSSRVHAGDAIVVALDPHHGEALISLTDASGAVAQAQDVPAAQRTVTLVAPQVSGPATYDVVVNFTRGVSEQEVVRPVTVIP